MGLRDEVNAYNQISQKTTRIQENINNKFRELNFENLIISNLSEMPSKLDLLMQNVKKMAIGEREISPITSGGAAINEQVANLGFEPKYVIVFLFHHRIHGITHQTENFLTTLGDTTGKLQISNKIPLEVRVYKHTFKVMMYQQPEDSSNDRLYTMKWIAYS